MYFHKAMLMCGFSNNNNKAVIIRYSKFSEMRQLHIFSRRLMSNSFCFYKIQIKGELSSAKIITAFYI